MKTTTHPLLYLLLLSAMLLYGCDKHRTAESEQEHEIARRGVISTSVNVTGTSADGSDEIERVRFIVFDKATTNPVLEINQLITVDDSNASVLEVTLEVNNWPSGNDKLVLVVANEPSSMTSTLNATTSYAGFQQIELDFAEFVADNHLAMKDDIKMPMTAATWTTTVYDTQAEAEESANRLKMQLQRAVARVDLYMKKDGDAAVTLRQGSYITLDNTYDKSYFIRNSDNVLTHSNTYSYGYYMTVAPTDLIPKTWSLEEDGIAIEENGENNGKGLFLCSFYTPERTCSASNDQDKLKLFVKIAIEEEETVRAGEYVLTDFIPQSGGTPEAIDHIVRNNVYEITLVVMDNSIDFNFEVINWVNAAMEGHEF